MAQDRGVQFLPGAAFYFRSATQNSMRLSFATENELAIDNGIQALGELLAATAPAPRADGAPAGAPYNHVAALVLWNPATRTGSPFRAYDGLPASSLRPASRRSTSSYVL